MKLFRIIVTVIIGLVLNMPTCNAQKVYPVDFSYDFDTANVSGSFMVYDIEKCEYFIHNEDFSRQRFMPASTFKIFNAMVAIEMNAIKDTSEIIEWDHIDRGWDMWNQDQTIRTAIRYSALWAFRNLARRINALDSTAYDRYVKNATYGNMSKSAHSDLFWLDNSLKISGFEQIEFLTRLYKEELPFEPETMHQVKDLIIVETGPNYVFRGKTGTGEIDNDGTYVGWYVGYIEFHKRPFAFCTCIQNNEPIVRIGDYRATYLNLTKNLLEKLANNCAHDDL